MLPEDIVTNRCLHRYKETLNKVFTTNTLRFIKCTDTYVSKRFSKLKHLEAGKLLLFSRSFIDFYKLFYFPYTCWPRQHPAGSDFYCSMENHLLIKYINFSFNVMKILVFFLGALYSDWQILQRVLSNVYRIFPSLSLWFPGIHYSSGNHQAERDPDWLEGPSTPPGQDL